MRIPAVSLLLALAALLVPLGALAPTLELDRQALGAEPWRLLTCHWTHWTLAHLAWDLAAFLALASAVELRPRGRRALLATVAGAALTVPAVLLAALPGIARYRGLSGIDAALFVVLALLLLREGRSRAAAGALALLAFAAKLAVELATGASLFATDLGGAAPVPLAHLAGGAWGLVAGLALHRPGRAVLLALLTLGCDRSDLCREGRPEPLTVQGRPWDGTGGHPR